MEATGIVRKVDSLGRVVIPRELRRLMDINEGDALEIFKSKNSIVFRKYSTSCSICGNSEKVKRYNGVGICESCREKIAKNIDIAAE